MGELDSRCELAKKGEEVQGVLTKKYIYIFKFCKNKISRKNMKW